MHLILKHKNYTNTGANITFYIKSLSAVALESTTLRQKDDYEIYNMAIHFV